MRTIEEIEADLEVVLSELSPLRDRSQSLHNELRDAKSWGFIAENEITLDDVELSEEHGKPCFGHIGVFRDWCKYHSDKPFFEWGGRLYFNRGDWALTDALLSHVPGMIVSVSDS